MKKGFFVMFVALMSALQASGQNVKYDNKDLVGVWIMESFQWEGEKETICDEKYGYTQFKYYGADGEYACAEIIKNNKGKIIVIPHEYGTYTYKDGWYSEMGRKPMKDAITWVDKTTTKGVWNKRHDIWKKQTNMPEKLRKYIVDYCKLTKPDEGIQQMLKQFVLK